VGSSSVYSTYYNQEAFWVGEFMLMAMVVMVSVALGVMRWYARDIFLLAEVFFPYFIFSLAFSLNPITGEFGPVETYKTNILSCLPHF
jgi:hypothetical protein